MSKLFEGRFDVEFDADKNVVELKKGDNGKYTAEDAEAIWELVCSRKKPLSKWSFYVADFNQTIDKPIHQFDPAKAVAWLKRQKVETVITVSVGRYGKPCLRVDPVTKTKVAKKSNKEIW